MRKDERRLRAEGTGDERGVREGETRGVREVPETKQEEKKVKQRTKKTKKKGMMRVAGDWEEEVKERFFQNQSLSCFLSCP